MPFYFPVWNTANRLNKISQSLGVTSLTPDQAPNRHWCGSGVLNLGTGFDDIKLKKSNGGTLKLGESDDIVELDEVEQLSVRLGNNTNTVEIKDDSKDIQIKGGAGNDSYDFFDRTGLGTITVDDPDGENTFITGQGQYALHGGKGTDTFEIGNGQSAGELFGGIGSNDDALIISSNIQDLDNGIHVDLQAGTFNDRTTGSMINFAIKDINIVEGSEFDDLLFGSNLADTLKGLKGKDTITGADGNDVLFGGKGDDIISGGNGNDTIFGGNDDDIISGGKGDDTLYVEDGDDIVTGGKGTDTLYGGDGTDTRDDDPKDLTFDFELVA